MKIFMCEDDRPFAELWPERERLAGFVADGLVTRPRWKASAVRGPSSRSVVADHLAIGWFATSSGTMR